MLVNAYIRRQSQNMEHPCFQKLLSELELKEEKDKFSMLSDEELMERIDEVQSLMEKFDFDTIRGKDSSFIFDGGNWKIEKSEHVIDFEQGSTPIYDWIDERIATEVIVLDEDGERTMPYEKLYPKHSIEHREGRKKCSCGRPTKVVFNGGFYYSTCLKSIQISHEACLWDLIASGVQFNWDDGETTYLDWRDLNEHGLLKGTIGEYILGLCRCSHQILDPTVWIF